MSTSCPGRLALCGAPCGCEGRNPSHYPQATVHLPRQQNLKPAPVRD